MANEGSSTTRMLRRTAAGTLACLLGLSALAGCTPTDPPKPSPTPTGIFASEDEALAAATDVYQKYTAALDKESATGDLSAEAMRPFVTPEYFEELEVPSLLQENGWHTTGATTFDNVLLVGMSESEQLANVRIRLCRDVSEVRILDASQRDVTPSTRTDRFPVEIQLVSSSPRSPNLVISDSGSWPGDDFC